jgi:hypothetical protein
MRWGLILVCSTLFFLPTYTQAADKPQIQINPPTVQREAPMMPIICGDHSLVEQVKKDIGEDILAMGFNEDKSVMFSTFFNKLSGDFAIVTFNKKTKNICIIQEGTGMKINPMFENLLAPSRPA